MNREETREITPPPPRDPGVCRCVLDLGSHGRDECGGHAHSPDVPYCRECLAMGHPHHDGQLGPRRGTL